MSQADSLPSFDPSELHLVDQYRRQKNTAVLTVLFTDIKGYTAVAEKYGEQFSNEFRRRHDALIYPIIERDNGGRVIKNIGDAVMAVFSEPSTAVTRSLEIQEAIREFNPKQPADQPTLSVRIGLHSGQVTMEDKVNLDVFGRHVNRAARVQSLADGGQILLTYPVYDSAKGWLTGNTTDHPPVAWKDHGRYLLKGIPDEIEIFEAYNPIKTQPMKPAGGSEPIVTKNQKSSAGLAYALAGIALVIAVGAGLAYYFFAQQAHVSLVDFSSDDDVTLDGRPILVGGQKTDHIRPVLSPLTPGRHLLTMPISNIVRNYAVLDVHPGENILPVRYTSAELLGISRSFDYSNPTTATPIDEKSQAEFDLFTLDNPKPQHVQGEANLKISASPSANSKVIIYHFEWTLKENGEVVNQDHHDISVDTTQTDQAPADHQLLLKRPDYFYEAHFKASATGASADIQGSFSDYLMYVDK